MAGPMPRPWFRLGSFTRPTTTATPAPPATEQPRPIPARIRPLLIRPIAATEPSQPTTPQPAKSPPQLPRPAPPTPLVKKEASPPPAAAKTLIKPVLPMLARPAVPSSLNVPNADTTVAKPSTPKGRSSSVAGSPPQSELFDKDSKKNPSPVPSPSILKSIPAVPAVLSPYLSPKLKAVASPPSPLLLPPPQLQSVAEPKLETIPQEVERKTVVFQKVMDKPSPPDNHNNKKQEMKKNDINKEKEKGNGAKKAEEKDSNSRVITMAGENRGATMEVVLSDKSGSGENKGKESKKKLTGTRNGRPMKAFCNSNVQGINNSILMNSNFSHHDPGIHLVFSRMPLVDDEDEDEDKDKEKQ